MKAHILKSYGSSTNFELVDWPQPTIKPNEVLIEVKAVSVNPADWHVMRASPFFVRFSTGLMRPKNPILGADFSGEVLEVGSEVAQYKVGDRVFGESFQGSFAEQHAVSVENIARIPENVSYEDAACLGIAAMTALQGLEENGKLQVGEHVLVNGSTGGVGHFAVQIAKAMGADVTAVCSGGKVDFARSLGADHVINYQQESIHEHNGQYDLILDTHGNMNFKDFKRLLAPKGRGILIGFTTMSNMMTTMIRGSLSKFDIKSFTQKCKVKDLQKLASWTQEGQIKPFIEKTYPFEDLPDAISYIENMRTKGKVVVSV